MTTTIISRWCGLLEDEGMPLQVRLAAAGALLRTNAPEAIERCAGALDAAPDSPIGRGVRELLVTQQGPPELQCMLLWEPDQAMRRAAVAQLLDQRSHRAVSDLAAVLRWQLREPQPDVPFCVDLIDAIASLHRPDDTIAAQIAAATITHTDHRVRQAAARALLRAQDAAPCVSTTVISHLALANGDERIEGTEIITRFVPDSLAASYFRRLLVEEDDALLRWIAHFELEQLEARQTAA